MKAFSLSSITKPAKILMPALNKDGERGVPGPIRTVKASGAKAKYLDKEPSVRVEAVMRRVFASANNSGAAAIGKS